MTPDLSAWFACWALCVALAAVWWLWRMRPRKPGPPRPADPYAGRVAEFRRMLADWDRAGWPE
jgi:hypothetical protein